MDNLNGPLTRDINESLDDIIKRSGAKYSLRRGSSFRGRRAMAAGTWGGRRGRGSYSYVRAGYQPGNGFGAGRKTNFENTYVPPGKWQHDRFEGTRMAARGGCQLRVANLASTVCDKDIKDLFGEIGPILKSAVHYNEHGQSLGIAEVRFSRRPDAMKAVQVLNNVPLDGRQMKITITDGEQKPSAAVGAALRLALNRGLRNTTVGAGKFGRLVRGGSARGGRRAGRGGRGRQPAPTTDSLDKDLDAYMKQ